MNECQILLKVFYLSLEYHVIFVFEFILLADYIYSFKHIEASLHLWNDADLNMIDNWWEPRDFFSEQGQRMACASSPFGKILEILTNFPKPVGSSLHYSGHDPRIISATRSPCFHYASHITEYLQFYFLRVNDKIAIIKGKLSPDDFFSGCVEGKVVKNIQWNSLSS